MNQEPGQKTKIKICGLKRPEDIIYVNEAKPDYAGFIIEVPKSSRNVTEDQVRELTAKLDPDIISVGVFVNAVPERVEKLLLEGTIHIAQLHGQEDEAYIKRIRKNTGHQIIKAFSVKTAIRTVHPYAVDLSSSVETDGVKDRDKILEAVQRRGFT